MITQKENTDNTRDRIVLVTGFGPFGSYKINASWAAVEELMKLDINDLGNIVLVTKEIPVIYEAVSTIVPQLISELKPMLVIHLGVSSMATCLTLESRAHKTGYVRSDNLLKLPDEETLSLEPGILETSLNVKQICEDVEGNGAKNDGCKACVSHDAGRYLCEYIFRESLMLTESKTIFVHVPENQIYSATKTAKGIRDVIRFAIKQIESAKN
ncbi:pyroglutamyl-peptidase 1 [Athalia rosae]|uniref:pyroglutamyl-peptidase 1 n=1 Tax=Athalia rosae TaxID=37344 RepID=UPI000625AD92|nr:pyroglutamyl-peptidase 1 [Athalia rosae]